MKISKQALSSLALFLLFLGIWDLIVILGLATGEKFNDLPLTVGLNLLLLYLVTENGYVKLKALLEIGKGFLALGVIIVVIGVVIGLGWWFLSSAGKGLSSIGKYEGQTAEEWFNSYDEEEAAHIQLKECLNDLPYGNFRGTDHYSLQSDIQNCIDQY